MNCKISSDFLIVCALIYVEKIKRFSKGIKTEKELVKKDFLFDAITRSIKILCKIIDSILKDNIVF